LWGYARRGRAGGSTRRSFTCRTIRRISARRHSTTDEVEAHGNKAGYAKPGMTDELAGDENEVEAHHFRHGDKAADKSA